jgi:DNA-directed RNA polymerase subunit RPC12/RpoP
MPSKRNGHEDKGIMGYTCVKCKGKTEKIEETVICPHCGFRVLMKDRVPSAKTILAR